MTVTDEAKLFAIRRQLLEMRFKLDASINIINYVFEGVDAPAKLDNGSVLGYDNSINPSVNKLYPGQIKGVPDTDIEEDGIECEE